MSIDTLLLHTPACKQWQQVGMRHHHGICFPLFSLHSEKSCGVGELYDLLPMIDWCHEIGLDVIQLLPLNDPGLGTSPYNAISAFALNPIHLNLRELEAVATVADYQDKLAKIGYWNRTKRVKHHIVRELKFAFLRDYFSRSYPEVANSLPYQSFIHQNQHWLEPYALFKALKENTFWKNWEDWPSPLKSPSTHGYQDLLQEHKEACAFHSFLQYLCFQQFEKVKKYATEKGVLLKGDIPFLISRDSADVWKNRHYFLLHLAVGAPPDMYTREGQAWGFPVYDWEAMAKHGYSWWRQRLQVASHLYHLYRLDHVVGFFRIWAIRPGKPASEGSFMPPFESDWLSQGQKLMEMMLEAAPILPIGEDLGSVPKEINKVFVNWVFAEQK
jgi:4-alpha-glucanotransferase